MKTSRIVSIGVVILPLFVSLARSASGQEKPPDITSIAVPKAGYSEIIFHGTAGRFQIHTRASRHLSEARYAKPSVQRSDHPPGRTDQPRLVDVSSHPRHLPAAGHLDRDAVVGPLVGERAADHVIPLRPGGGDEPGEISSGS